MATLESHVSPECFNWRVMMVDNKIVVSIIGSMILDKYYLIP